MAVVNDRAWNKKRKYDPEDEIAFLRKKLDEERAKRRSLEGDIYRLKLERSDLCIKMSKLEASKISPNIPSSFIPLLSDAIGRGLDPSKFTAQTDQSLRVVQQAAQLQAQAAQRSLQLMQANEAKRTHSAAKPSISSAPRPVGRPPGSTSSPARKVTFTPDRPGSRSIVMPKSAPAKAGTAVNVANVQTLPVGTIVTAVPAGSPAGTPGQQFMVQSKVENGKKVSFLVPVQQVNVAPEAAPKIIEPVVDLTAEEDDMMAKINSQASENLAVAEPEVSTETPAEGETAKEEEHESPASPEERAVTEPTTSAAAAAE
ncbi:hypothetical protein RvY_00122 [Ramazzottius varieornatus]|uniref:Uncharacterized protein n=1 Tax=Ramazzottius varieornatus TaxID=947166 RepID=A0A1D1UBL4_RAMVA|nr:hypothetical protein RvY_00122 [Ramazzottius varieornatus]